MQTPPPSPKSDFYPSPPTPRIVVSLAWQELVKGVAASAIIIFFAAAFLSPAAKASSSDPTNVANPALDQTKIGPLNVREYRVTGAKRLTPAEIGEAVYPFLGPGRTIDHVEGARAAVEALYKEKGFQTVNVEVPDQDARRGIVILKVNENTVGRLRVKGSRYFSLTEIKKRAPSLAEGSLPNFNEITKEILALNTWADRRVTPSLHAGVEPGTVDIDLEVKDSLPLHGSVELNNRYSPDTVELRLNGSVSYTNLWQGGHTLGFNFQIAPQRIDDALVYSAYYSARFPQLPWLNLILQGTKQDSNVSTLGGAAVAGRGEIFGARAVVTLPPLPNFYHSLTFGYDYKSFEEQTLFGLLTTQAPIEYDPFSIAYSATWAAAKGEARKLGHVTELNAGVTFHLRGLGADEEEFDTKRFGASGSFFYLRGDLAHTHDLPGGMELYALVQGQASGQALVNSEQFSGGGLGTARGYLESQVLGDNALMGTLEFRSPSLLNWWKGSDSEWRIYAFLDAGVLTLNDPLPEQVSRFELASYGFGSNLRLLGHFNGSIDAGIPLISQGTTLAHDLLLTFRVWADF